MKLLIQILFLFLTWFLSSVTPVFAKVTIPNYSVSFSKSGIQNLESEIKIGVSNFARSGISASCRTQSENSASQKAFFWESYILENRARKGKAKEVNGAGKFSITKLDDYLKNISTRNPAGAVGSPPRVYQESVTTGIEYELKGGANAKIWADGLDKSTGTVIEAKYISNPSASPFVEGSSCYPPVRQKILDEVTDEFRRYSEIIKDPNTPLVHLEVFVSDASGVPYFQKLLNDFSIPGKVTVKP